MSTAFIRTLDPASIDRIAAALADQGYSPMDIETALDGRISDLTANING